MGTRDEAIALLNGRARKTLKRAIVPQATGRREGSVVDETASRAPIQFLRTRRLSEFPARAVGWLWRPWLPAGKLTILDGYPGDGKSHIAASIVAALTTGSALPGGVPAEPCDVLWLSYEEDPHDTIRPRLEAAGADLTRVHLVEGIDRGDNPPGEVSTADGRLIEDRINELAREGVHVRALIIDPLSLALPVKTDTTKDTDVRHALLPLARLAERLGVAVLVVRHFNKSQGEKALLKGGGSIGFAAAARAVWTVTDHPDRPEWKALAVAKLSNGKKPLSRAFRIVGASLPPTLGALQVVETSRLEWGEELAQSADELLGATYEDAERREERQSCCGWLNEFLECQPDQSAKAEEVCAAGKKAGFSDRTIRSAAQRGGVIRERSGFGGGSTYRLPSPVHSGTQPHSGPVTVPERPEVPECTGPRTEKAPAIRRVIQ